MKALSTYRVNQPTTADGHSISIKTIIFGTEEEIEYIRKNCAETIGSGLLQEYGSPLTSQFFLLNQERIVPDNMIDNAQTVNTDEIYKKGYHAGFFATHGEPERPQGEWKFKKFDEETGISNSDWCPFCGKAKAQIYDNFCGNCGAQLKKGE